VGGTANSVACCSISAKSAVPPMEEKEDLKVFMFVFLVFVDVGLEEADLLLFY
jgi:hypothetical protein